MATTKSKIVYVSKIRKGRTTIYAGTLEELRTNVFGYTLQCGNSWNKKISLEPKSASSLVNNLNKSVEETQGGCFDQDSYYLATKEEYDAYNAPKPSTTVPEPVVETPAPEVTVEEPKIYKNVKEILDNTKLTEKEVMVVKLLNDQLKSYFGEMYSDIDCNDIAKLLEWDVKTVKGVIGSLTKKNIVTTWDTGTGYEVISLVNQDEMSFYHFKADEETIPAPAKVKASAKKASGAQPITETVKTTAHKVGDIHKNGKWFWTEYKPGKFDWRNIKVK